MKKLLVLIIGCLLFASCSNGWDMPKSEGSGSSVSYPKLQIVNDIYQENVIGAAKYYISKVSLVNYIFEPLYLSDGESQTFTLDKGMPAGYDDIFVSIIYDPDRTGVVSRSFKTKVSFKNGKTTVIRLSEISSN